MALDSHQEDHKLLHEIWVGTQLAHPLRCLIAKQPGIEPYVTEHDDTQLFQPACVRADQPLDGV